MHKQPINLPITALSGVGTALAIRLGELGIYRVFDMLMHLPRDYEDRSRIIPMRELSDGMTCMVAGTVTDVQKGRNGLLVCLTDGSGTIGLKFFKTYPALLQIMTVGAKLSAFGKCCVRSGC